MKFRSDMSQCFAPRVYNGYDYGDKIYRVSPVRISKPSLFERLMWTIRNILY